MASRLTVEKNIEYAIRSLSLIAKKIPKVLLLVVGDGPQKTKLINEAKRQECPQNIKFEPTIDSETLISYYKTADLFLLTSNYEGYGRTIVEAMIAGCPIVTTNVGVVGELLQNGVSGSVVDFEKSESLAESILEILEDKATSDNYRQEGMNAANNLLLRDKSKYVARFKDLLASLLANKSKSS